MSRGFLELFFALLTFKLSLGQDAEVEIGPSAPCSPRVLLHRGVDITRYRPRIVFDRADVELTSSGSDPKKISVPGCMKLVAKNVTVLAPIRKLTAEFDMRVGGVPNPRNPRISCKKSLGGDDKDGCSCNSGDGSCVFCDFCKRMTKHLTKYSIHESKKQEILLQDPNKCDCDTIHPGQYDIEAELCTPPAEEIAEAIPDDIKEFVEDGKPLSMFTTILLYDFDFRSQFNLINLQNSTYLSPLGRQILEQRREVLEQRKNSQTVGCYLVGSDVFFKVPDLFPAAPPRRTGQ